MDPHNLDPHKLLEFLKKNTGIVPKFCDNCGGNFRDEDIQVMGIRNNMLACRTNCESCGTMHMLNVSMPVNGVGMASRAPINVDLSTAAEFDKFAGKPAVTVDDAIDTYRSLDSIGSLSEFLNAASPSSHISDTNF